MIWIVLTAIACAADAVTTNSLIKRGGYEKLSAWIIGKYPAPWKVWAWVFAAPVAAVAALLSYDERFWPAALGTIAARLWFAHSNNKKGSR